MATLEVDEAVSGFDWPAFGGSTELDPDRLTVWVTNSDRDSVTRIDLAAPTVASLEESVTTFKPSERWNLVLTTIDPNGSQDLPIVWAANVSFSPEESTSGFPSNTVRDIPADGIVITVIGPRKYTGDTVLFLPHSL